MYNFHKVRGDRQNCEFEHEKFKRGHQELLSQIKRKQSESLIMSANTFFEGANPKSDSNEHRKIPQNISCCSIK